MKQVRSSWVEKLLAAAGSEALPAVSEAGWAAELLAKEGIQYEQA